jgi:hypothetical protein
LSFEDAAPVEGVTAEVGPEETGETEQQATEPSEGIEQEPVRQYVEVDDPDNRYVRTRIDGEDVEVPFSEALKGYSRESHFTKNMQEVAQQRQEAEYGLRLQQALEANPEITLQILAQQHGYNLVEPQAPPAEDEPEYADPLEREIVQERKARQALEERFAQREADEQLHQAVAGLRSQYNLSDEDLQTVVQTAFQLNLGVQALPMIYKTMQFDRIDARVRAQRADQQRQQAETQRRQQAKTQASTIIGNGRGSANGLTAEVDAGGRMNLRDAIEAAYDAATGG